MKPPSKAGVRSEEQTAADKPLGCPEELCHQRLNLPLMSAGSLFEERRKQKSSLVTVVTDTFRDRKKKTCRVTLKTQATIGSVLHNKYLNSFFRWTVTVSIVSM